jgi:NAD(P)-dependent dehydrogenase (short-subunit alcohol dehydrogenase family)
MQPLTNWDEAAFDRSLGIIFKGLFFLIQALLQVFANPASIVLNTSINARIGMPNTSTTALLSLARTLSAELFSRGIRVNAVSPGPIANPAFCSSSGCRTTLLRQFPIPLRPRFP